MLYSKQGVDKNGGLSHNEQKRETYNVQVKYSILFECALGIAAITHKG